MIATLDRFKAGVHPPLRGFGRGLGDEELVVLGDDEELRAGIGSGGGTDLVPGQYPQRRGDSDPAVKPFVGHRKRHIGAERPSAENQRAFGPEGDEGIDRGRDVERLGPAVSVLTSGSAHPAEVEAQYADAPEGEESEEFTRHE